MITDTEGKLLAAAEYSSKSLLITRFAYASAIRLTLPTATGIHKMAEVLEENTTPAQDYERGRSRYLTCSRALVPREWCMG